MNGLHAWLAEGTDMWRAHGVKGLEKCRLHNLQPTTIQEHTTTPTIIITIMGPPSARRRAVRRAHTPLAPSAMAQGYAHHAVAEAENGAIPAIIPEADLKVG